MSGRRVDSKLVRRGAAVSAVALVLGTATLLAVTGAREPAAALKLLTGRAWLANARVGTASQIDGYSGKVGAQAPVGSPGDPFRVVQRPDGAYVLDLKTGKLTRLSDATLSAAASRQLPGKPSALQVLAGPAGTWVLDQSSGVLQQVDPQSLAPEGPSIPFGGPTGPAVLDADGNPWVPVPAKATVEEVTPSGLQAHPFGSQGDVLSLQVTSRGVWAVDGQAGQARPLSGPGPVVQLPQLPAGAGPVTGSATTSPYLPVVVGDQLLDVDTGRSAVGSTTSPDFAGAQQVALVGNVAYLLAPGASHVDAVNLAPLAQQPPIPVPAGSDQLLSKDGLLFVNNANSSQAVVVTPGGGETPVSKYTPAPAAPSPAAPPSALASPLPLPTQAGVSAAPGAPATQIAGPANQPGAVGTAPGGAPVAAIPGPTLVAPPAPTPAPPNPTPSPQAPGAPTLAPVNASGPTLDASWTPPTSSGSTPITSYKLTVTPQTSGTTPPPQTVGGQSTTASVSGLSGNTTYCAQVQAVNAAGAGPLSNSQCAKTSNDVPGSPGTPSVTLGTDSGKGQAATATWTAPTNLGPFQTPIAKYQVTASPSSGASTTVESTSTTASLSLALGQTYTVSVKAVNANGNASAASTSAAFQTDGPPGAVSGLTVTPYDGELDVSWSAASANHGQSVTYTVSDGVTSSTTSATNEKFTGLTPGHSYTVTVTPKTAAGDGTPSKASGTPWGPRNPSYLCTSAANWGNYPFTSAVADCGNQAGYSQSTPGPPTPNVWVTGAAPPGSEILWNAVIGTTSAAGTEQDSHWYSVKGSNDLPPGWNTGTGGPLTRMAYVFPSQAAAGPGSEEWCEVYHADNTHPWYNIYPVNQLPAGTSGCMAGTHFWN